MDRLCPRQYLMLKISIPIWTAVRRSKNIKVNILSQLHDNLTITFWYVILAWWLCWRNHHITTNFSIHCKLAKENFDDPDDIKVRGSIINSFCVLGSINNQTLASSCWEHLSLSCSGEIQTEWRLKFINGSFFQIIFSGNTTWNISKYCDIFLFPASVCPESLQTLSCFIRPSVTLTYELESNFHSVQIQFI